MGYGCRLDAIPENSTRAFAVRLDAYPIACWLTWPPLSVSVLSLPSCCFVLVRDLLFRSSHTRTYPLCILTFDVFWRLVLAGATECRVGCARDHRGLRGALGELAVGVLRRQLPPLAFTMTGERDKVKVGLGFDRLAVALGRLVLRPVFSCWFGFWLACGSGGGVKNRSRAPTGLEMDPVRYNLMPMKVYTCWSVCVIAGKETTRLLLWGS